MRSSSWAAPSTGSKVIAGSDGLGSVSDGDSWTELGTSAGMGGGSVGSRGSGRDIVGPTRCQTHVVGQAWPMEEANGERYLVHLRD